jgi:hypothetical protein
MREKIPRAEGNAFPRCKNERKPERREDGIQCTPQPACRKINLGDKYRCLTNII